VNFVFSFRVTDRHDGCAQDRARRQRKH
jgi:hypothetical protein